MANATMEELKKTNPTMDLQVQAYRLGQVYFKILKNSTVDRTSSVKLVSSDSATVADKGTQSSVDYRLVPDTRDLIGARMLLTMEAKDGEELKKQGGMTQELAQKAIKKAMTESKKFNSTFNEIPIFMIQQVRSEATKRCDFCAFLACCTLGSSLRSSTGRCRYLFANIVLTPSTPPPFVSSLRLPRRCASSHPRPTQSPLPSRCSQCTSPFPTWSRSGSSSR